MKLNLDPWQTEILNTKGSIILCAGRQVGKSTIIAVRDGERAAKNKNESILIIAPTERQSEEIFQKILIYLTDNYRFMIKKGRDRPTKHVVKLTNGSIIRCLPTGTSGTGIRGFTISKLTAEEAAYIQEDVWAAVTPMLLTTGGDMDLLGTPFGKQGYFYNCYLNKNNDFKVFHVSTEEVINQRAISPTWTQRQREEAIKHLEREKLRMSKNEYLQEYCGVFVEENAQYFADALIKKACVGKRLNKEEFRNYYLGVDIARLGKDATVYAIGYKEGEDKIVQTESIVKRKQLTTQTEEDILVLTRQWNLRKIFIDAGSGSLGVGIFDHLLEEPETRNKVIAINNRDRPLNRDKDRKTKILKEDLYDNLRRMMEKGFITILEDDEIISSLKSIQYEYITEENTNKAKTTKVRIFSATNNNHCAESLIRLSWAVKEKHINLWCGYTGNRNIN